MSRGQSVEEVRSMTGRKALWTGYWEKFVERPIIGYGYATASRTQGIVYQTNTHNSFFAVILGSGLLGLGICAWTAVLFIREGLPRVRDQMPGSIGCLCALGAGLMNSMSISIFAESFCPPAFVFIAIYAFHLFAFPSPSVRSNGFSKSPKLAFLPRPSRLGGGRA